MKNKSIVLSSLKVHYQGQTVIRAINQWIGEKGKKGEKKENNL